VWGESSDHELAHRARSGGHATWGPHRRVLRSWFASSAYWGVEDEPRSALRVRFGEWVGHGQTFLIGGDDRGPGRTSRGPSGPAGTSAHPRDVSGPGRLEQSGRQPGRPRGGLAFLGNADGRQGRTCFFDGGASVSAGGVGAGRGVGRVGSNPLLRSGTGGSNGNGGSPMTSQKSLKGGKAPGPR